MRHRHHHHHRDHPSHGSFAERFLDGLREGLGHEGRFAGSRFAGGFGEDFGPGPGGGRFGRGGRHGGGGHGGHGHGGHGGRGRRMRLFGQGELGQLLLALIVETPRHGYDLIREVEALTGGAYAPSPGVVYPTLSYMEDEGLIAAEEGEGGRKTYAATDAGKARAAEEAEAAVALRERLAGLAADRDRVDPAPVRRAMQNLKMAAMGRLSQGEPSRDLVLALAEIIDEAARKVERSEG